LKAYAPDISKPKKEREIFFEELQNTADKLSNNEKIFIINSTLIQKLETLSSLASIM
jgi:hypothetical protein